MVGLVGLIGDVTPKSTLPRGSTLMGHCLVAVVVVVVVAFEVWVLASRVAVVVVFVWVGDLGTGHDIPRSFPRLAMPTPHVNTVRYPVHSFPSSMHGPQYGRRRSHLICLFLHAKQSSLAPPAGALLLRFLGAAVALGAVVFSGFWASVGCLACDDMVWQAIVGSEYIV